MRYAIDTEFIDTPTCSALISLGIVREDGEWRYFEFDYPKHEITHWLAENVVPQLGQPHMTFAEAAKEITVFVGPNPEFWCYYGAYDWYWFCRWPMLFHDYAHVRTGIQTEGEEHNALVDARALMDAMADGP
jgi:hypothetical protein